VTCRPYSQDKVAEIVPDELNTGNIKYKVYNTNVSSRYETENQICLWLNMHRPERQLNPDGTESRPEGMYLLKVIPDTFAISPMPFIKGIAY